MKKTVLAFAIAAVFSVGAHAQAVANGLAGQGQTTNVTSGSSSQAVAQGGGGGAGGSAVNAGNNQTFNPSINFNSPEVSTVNQNVSGTTTQNQNVNGRTEQVLSGERTEKVVYSGDYKVKNVPSMNAPNLTSSNDTCMGSASGAVSVAGFGLGGGSTYADEHCKRIKMSRELWNKGMKAASLAMDCMDPDAKTALELTGFVCPQTEQARANRPVAEAPAQGTVAPTAWRAQTVPASFAGANMSDPYIAGRAK
jgi:hypothetical protein